FPSPGNAVDLGLPAQNAFRSHFACNACYFRRERTELIHHLVDCVLQFEEFAPDIHRDFLRQMSIRYRCCYCRDVAHLRSEIGCRSEEHTSELQSQSNLVCRLLLEKKKIRPTPDVVTVRHNCHQSKPSER